MPAALAIGLVTSAITNLVGSKVASNAAKKAAQTQSASADRAMQFEREGQDKALAAINQNYGRAAGLYDPYMAIGRNVMPSLTALAGSNYGKGGSPIYVPQQAPPPSLAATPAAGGTVMMMAPNGQRKQVPANQVDHYRQRGAQVVN